MNKFNRREFLEATAASCLMGAVRSEVARPTQVSISENGKSVCTQGSEYAWEWSKETDHFRILDQWGLVIAEGGLQPAVVVVPQQGAVHCLAGKAVGHEVQGNQVSIHYEDVNRSARLTMVWRFDKEGFWLEPVDYETSGGEAVVSLHYFAQGRGNDAVPALGSDYFVVPGITTSSELSPLVPSGSSRGFVPQTCWLGHGWGHDPKVLYVQQWGLPVHYFCAFHRSPYSYQRKPLVKIPEPPGKSFLETYLNAVCCGLAELPNADLKLETRNNLCSPFLNYRGDVWGHLHGPGRLTLGARLYWTVGPNYYEAIRRYYLGLAKADVIHKKTNSEHKNAVALAPSFCGYGEQVALGRTNQRLDEKVLNEIYEGLKHSGTEAKLFVVDAKWESKWGSLRHSEDRLPHFIRMLDRFRSQGMYVGLWTAFLRAEDPATIGLTLANMLHTRHGKPYRLGHEPHGYYIMDCTQTKVQAVMRQLAKQFMRRYRPDFVKFDFGYEIPSLDVVAPRDMAWAGERFLLKALQVSIGAMREVNPDLVVLYYSLSPLFLDYFDLHSPDDLGLCMGDYDLEANRRFFFSSLLGELGMPTWGSSGYDWPTAPSIWFDSAAVGTLGSLLSYWGPEAEVLGKPEIIAKYNGLTHVLRSANTYSIILLDEAYTGAARGAHASSWARREHGELVLVALRRRRFGGGQAAKKFKDQVSTTAPVVVASKTSVGLARAAKLAVVPYGDGQVSIRREGGGMAMITEHHFGGGKTTKHIDIAYGRLKVPLREHADDGSVVEWIEVDISAI